MNYLNGMQVTKAILGLSVLAAVSGCGRSSTKNNGEKAQENDQKLTGEWRNACAPSNWLGLSHQKVDLKFGPLGDFDETTTLFSDEGCSAPVTVLAQRGTYASLDAAKGVDGATNVNFTITSDTVTPQTEDAAKLLSGQAYCGITTWAKGVATDVMDKSCLGQSHPNGQVSFDIYRLDHDNNRLTLGKQSLFLDKDAADSRPTKLDDSSTFDRQ